MYESLLAGLGEFDNPPPRSFPLIYLFPSRYLYKIIIAFSSREPHPTKKQTEKETETETESETESEPSGNRNPKHWPRPEQKQNRNPKHWPRPEAETETTKTEPETVTVSVLGVDPRHYSSFFKFPTLSSSKCRVNPKFCLAYNIERTRSNMNVSSFSSWNNPRSC